MAVGLPPAVLAILIDPGNTGETPGADAATEHGGKIPLDTVLVQTPVLAEFCQGRAAVPGGSAISSIPGTVAIISVAIGPGCTLITKVPCSSSRSRKA